MAGAKAASTRFCSAFRLALTTGFLPDFLTSVKVVFLSSDTLAKKASSILETSTFETSTTVRVVMA